MLKAVSKTNMVEVWRDGTIVAILRDQQTIFRVHGIEFEIEPRDVSKRSYALNRSGAILATVESTSWLGNSLTIAFAGRQWQFRPEGLFSREFGLYDATAKVGSIVLTSYFLPATEITINMPQEFSLEAQIFLLWIYLRQIEARASG